ncbi:MAG: J domain-containing protein, partial [Elusimicrobiota bacterium]|nr:J domain-containing protein [Elusimicrobiota bacterium]
TQVKLPAKIADGARVKLKGLGNKSARGAGDLYINVKIAPSPYFRLEGNDIYHIADITPWTAALGGAAQVLMPGGGSVNIKVPAGARSGAKVKLSGKGLGSGGDMYVQFMINNPKNLNKTQRELFEKLALEEH